MSDQDFFFDEDEKPAPKQAAPATKSGSKQAAKSTAPKADAAAPARSSSAIELTWTVTALISVVALLVGVIVGYSIPKGASTPADTTLQQSGTAPQLSPEELQSGQLPAGHPDISGVGGSSAATGSATTTTGK